MEICEQMQQGAAAHAQKPIAELLRDPRRAMEASGKGCQA